jgi:hypothetical protein
VAVAICLPLLAACSPIWTTQAANSRRSAHPVPIASLGLGQALERAAGIEPAYSAWEADVLPLNYARMLLKEGNNFSPSPSLFCMFSTESYMLPVVGGLFQPRA